MTALARLGRRLQDLVRSGFDRANPILARGIRQELRNRTFFALYLLLLGVAGVASIVLAVVARDGEREAGAILFAILGGALTFTLFIPQAFNAYRAMIRERDDDTWDLIQLTGIRPGRLLRGVLWANFFQSLYYLAAVAPFMVMAYLLRGIDLVTIVLLIGYCICAGLVTSSMAIFWGCLGNNKASRAALGLLLALGLMGLWGWNIGLWVLITETMFVISMLLNNTEELVLVVLACLNGTGMAVVLLLGLASSLVTFPADNRSTLPRALWILAWLNLVAWLIIVGNVVGMSDRDWLFTLMLMGMLGLVWFLPYGFLAITEDYGLSRRQARSIENPHRLLAPFVWALGPGAARGRQGWVVLSGICLALAMIGGAGGSYEDEVAGAALGIFIYSMIFFQLGDHLGRNLLGKICVRPAQRRACIMALMIAAIILPLLVQLVAGFDEDGIMTYFNPFWGAVNVAGHYDRGKGFFGMLERQPGLLLLVIMAVGAAILFLVQGSARYRIELVRVRAEDTRTRRRARAESTRSRRRSRRGRLDTTWPKIPAEEAPEPPELDTGDPEKD